MKLTRRHQVALSLWLGTFLIYIFLPSYDFSYDGICYALDVEFGSWMKLLHPNHPIYSPLMRLFYNALNFSEPAVRAIPIMIKLNAMIGASAIALLYWALSDRHAHAPSALGSLAFAFSAAFWKETIDPGCYALAGLGTVITLQLLLGGNHKSYIITGILHGLCVFSHLMIVLASPAFILKILLKNGSNRRKIVHILQYGLGLMLLVGGTYQILGLAFYKGSVVAPFALRSAGIAVSNWWNWDLAQNARVFWDTFVRSWVGIPTAWRDPVNLFLYASVSLTLLWMILMTIRLLINQKRMDWQVSSLWAWSGVMSLLHFWWAVGAHRFRILIGPALIACFLELQKKNRFPRATIHVSAVIIALMGAWNYVVVIRPFSRPSANPDLVRSMWVRNNLHGNDFLFFAGHGRNSITNVALAYFAGEIPARSLYGILYDTSKTDLAQLNAYVQETKQRKGRFFIESSLKDAAYLEKIAKNTDAPQALVKWIDQFRVKLRLVAQDGFAIEQLE